MSGSGSEDPVCLHTAGPDPLFVLPSSPWAYTWGGSPYSTPTPRACEGIARWVPRCAQKPCWVEIVSFLHCSAPQRESWPSFVANPWVASRQYHASSSTTLLQLVVGVIRRVRRMCRAPGDGVESADSGCQPRRNLIFYFMLNFLGSRTRCSGGRCAGEGLAYLNLRRNLNMVLLKKYFHR